jgi:hypothetical protein
MIRTIDINITVEVDKALLHDFICGLEERYDLSGEASYIVGVGGDMVRITQQPLALRRRVELRVSDAAELLECFIECDFFTSFTNRTTNFVHRERFMEQFNMTDVTVHMTQREYTVLRGGSNALVVSSSITPYLTEAFVSKFKVLVLQQDDWDTVAIDDAIPHLEVFNRVYLVDYHIEEARRLCHLPVVRRSPFITFPKGVNEWLHSPATEKALALCGAHVVPHRYAKSLVKLLSNDLLRMVVEAMAQ